MSDKQRPHPIDPTRCAVCGEGNACGLASGATTTQCWCFAVTVDPQQLADLPPEAQGKACLCPRCARGKHPDATG